MGDLSTSTSSMNALVPRDIDQALRLADVMAKASLMPAHLKGKPGDCLLVVMQAQRWGMDAVSVAQSTSVVSGKLCYEGKLVAAALYAMGAIEGRLSYEFSGEGEGRTVTITGRPRGSSKDQTVIGTVKDWKTGNENWKKIPDDMLVYRGTRQWARRYAPEALLGIYTPDEIEEQPQAPRDMGNATRVEPARQELPPYPEADFEANLPTWHEVIAKGKKTPDEIIAMVSTKGVLSDDQKAEIRAGHAADADFIAEMEEGEQQ